MTLASIPDEIVLQIICLLCPADLISFSRTCRQYHTISMDDELWLTHCLNPIREHLHPLSVGFGTLDAEFLKAQLEAFLQEEPVGGRKATFYLLYACLIGPRKWMLGWWMAADKFTSMSNRDEPIADYGSLWRFSFRVSAPLNPTITSDALELSSLSVKDQYDVDNSSICIVGQRLAVKPDTRAEGSMPTHPLVINLFRSLGVFRDEHILTIADVRPSRLWFDHGEPEGIEMVDRDQDDPPQFVISLDGLQSAYSNLGYSWDVLFSRTSDYAPWEDDDVRSLNRVARDRDGGEVIRTSWSYNNAPFPRPSVLPLIRDLRMDTETGRPTMTRMGIKLGLKAEHEFLGLIPIHSPLTPYSSLSSEKLLLYPGVYTTNYGSHGPEYLLVSFRTITPSDLSSDISWAWEGSLAPRQSPTDYPDVGDPDWSDPSNHFGPFSCPFGSSSLGSLEISQKPEDLRVGARLMEITKVTGDEDVPQGQVSILAFLDDPLVDQSRLRDAIDHLPMKPSEGGFPWPLVPHPDPVTDVTQRQLFETLWAPSCGVDLPACGRIAGLAFGSPTWSRCVVHIESREEFAVWWEDLRDVTIFRKVSGLPL